MHLILCVLLTSILVLGSLLATSAPTTNQHRTQSKSYSLPITRIKSSSAPLTGDKLLASIEFNMERIKAKYAAKKTSTSTNNSKSTIAKSTTTKSKIVNKKVATATARTTAKLSTKPATVAKSIIQKPSTKKIVQGQVQISKDSIKVINSKSGLTKVVKILAKVKSRASGEQTLVDFGGDQGYYSSIQVGTPPVSYQVLIDTGSPDLFLLSAGCDYRGGCFDYNPLYAPLTSSSKDLNSTYLVRYLVNYALGKLYKDQVSFAGVSGSLNFGSITTMGGGLPDGVSGILGLGYYDPDSAVRFPFLQ